MIQIELPCCGAIADLEPEAVTVRCEACSIEHLLAPDACLAASDGARVDATVDAASAPVPARVAVLAA